MRLVIPERYWKYIQHRFSIPLTKGNVAIITGGVWVFECSPKENGTQILWEMPEAEVQKLKDHLSIT